MKDHNRCTETWHEVRYLKRIIEGKSWRGSEDHKKPRDLTLDKRMAILQGYIKGMALRQDWGGIDRDEVQAFLAQNGIFPAS